MSSGTSEEAPTVSTALDRHISVKDVVRFTFQYILPLGLTVFGGVLHFQASSIMFRLEDVRSGLSIMRDRIDVLDKKVSAIEGRIPSLNIDVSKAVRSAPAHTDNTSELRSRVDQLERKSDELEERCHALYQALHSMR